MKILLIILASIVILLIIALAIIGWALGDPNDIGDEDKF